MDAFFASVEQRDNPELRGKPVLVGGTGNRGVVSAASYEARAYGCHSAMPMARARSMCPQAIVIKGSYSKYREASGQVFSIFDQFTDLVQPVSIDEAFLDVTGCQRLHGTGEKIARNIRRKIFEETGLTASVGVAPNKFLAKLASDLKKPDGLTIITTDTINTILPPLPLTRIWGIGEKTANRMHGLGLKTFADLRRMDAAWYETQFGSWGTRMRELVFGIDDRPVATDDEAKSIGHEQTFGENLTDPDAVRQVLLEQAQAVGLRLRRQKYSAHCVTVKIRFGNFQTITRSHTLSAPTDLTTDLYAAAVGLFDEWANAGFQSVRLIGLQTSHFTREAQLDLFQHVEKERLRKVDRAVDAIKTRFGSDSIRRGH